MRVAILMKKAVLEGIPMSEDVAFFVAKHLRSNVRELEGALRKILAFVRFHGREVTIEVARTALKDLLSIQTAKFQWKIYKRRLRTSTASRWPTCTPKSVQQTLPGPDKLPCLWLKN